MGQDKLVLIRQALAAAESSIKTAKQLLSEVESGGLHVSAKDLPGELGVFDGIGMTMENGEKLEVPANYASKSMLVVGDTLKRVDENGEKRFKQIEHVKRHKTVGILHKKDGKFKVITPEGSYSVLEAAVDHFKGDVGDEVVLHLPAGNLTAVYGAIEMILKPGEKMGEEATQPEPVEVKSMQQVVDVIPKIEPNEANSKSVGVSRPKRKKKKPVDKVSVMPSTPAAQPPQPAPSVQPPPRPPALFPAPGDDDELR
jgi:hypothetical protein